VATRQNWRNAAWGVDEHGNPLPSTYIRLREGIERFGITDINNPAAGATAASSMPVMWDAWGGDAVGAWHTSDNAIVRFNHVPGGSNVLYLDGHVTFVKYSANEYPIGTGEPGTLSFHAKWIGTSTGGFG
jgi:prepilin-type processing-associated H-X9-DG protein